MDDKHETRAKRGKRFEKNALGKMHLNICAHNTSRTLTFLTGRGRAPELREWEGRVGKPDKASCWTLPRGVGGVGEN